jgi:hypothetical protein
MRAEHKKAIATLDLIRASIMRHDAELEIHEIEIQEHEMHIEEHEAEIARHEKEGDDEGHKQLADSHEKTEYTVQCGQT